MTVSLVLTIETHSSIAVMSKICKWPGSMHMVPGTWHPSPHSYTYVEYSRVSEIDESMNLSCSPRGTDMFCIALIETSIYV